jgi:uncharacterized membrane protein
MSGTLLVLAVFLACAVEAVEALTIVLAAGLTRGWSSPLVGVASALAVLAVIVAVFGPAIGHIPLNILRVVVGTLLLIFGLQWLRKAILRASGHKARHDETAIYQRQASAAQSAARHRRAFVTDWYAFTLAFKGVLLEGLEVAFIVVTFGANQGHLASACLGAALAVILVTIVGVLLKKPLSRVPENTMKFVVGILLTSFGTFWAAEGAGADWPGADRALLALIPGFLLVSLLFIALLRRRPPATSAPDLGPSRTEVTQ